MAFHQLTYTVKKAGADFSILKGVSAFFMPGRLVRPIGAPLGCSGARLQNSFLELQRSINFTH